MNIRPAIFLLFIFSLSVVSQAQEPVLIELPLTMHRGYGPFSSAYAGLGTYRKNDEKNPWMDTYFYAKGIPDTWTEVQQGTFDTNIYQTTYQNYHANKITEEWYTSLQKSWNWTPDPELLSVKPVKTRVAFATGKDASGQERMIVDANNNLDFSDDVAFTPIDMELAQQDKTKLDHVIEVSCEFFVNGEIVPAKVPVSIVRSSRGNMLMRNFPQYATVDFNGHTIALSSTHFTELSWHNTDIMFMPDTQVTDEPITSDRIISMDNYLTIDGTIYKNKGVNTRKQVLVLERVTVPKDQLYSTQVGFRPPVFEGNNMLNGEQVSLQDYQGKYLLIDFWAIWCGPCLQEMPNLKALYEKTDRSRFEIVGIVGDSPADGVTKMIEKYGITWPQILSNQDNNITKAYRVNGYPTVLLLDPDGMIIGKNLRGKALEQKIEELLQP